MSGNWNCIEQKGLLELAQEIQEFINRFRKYAPEDLYEQEPFATLLLRYEGFKFLITAVQQGKSKWQRLAEEVYLWCEKLGWNFPWKGKVVVCDSERNTKRIYCRK
jgi:hypothetical protein